MLTRLGLPTALVEKLKQKGISSLFPWQEECLQTLLDADPKARRHLVYSAPTSGGKSLVADILLWRAVSALNCWALLIFPFVALVREKEATLSAVGEMLGKRVASFHYASRSVYEDDFDIAVATIEKGTVLWSRALADMRATQPTKKTPLGVIVVDEFHTFHIPGRGDLIENALIKSLFFESLAQRVSAQHVNDDMMVVGCGGGLSDSNSDCPQIIVMSATFPAMTKIAKWLNAVEYKCNYRPVPLREYLVLGFETELLDQGSFTVDHTFDPARCPFPEVAEKCSNVIRFVLEPVMTDSHSSLLFCASRKECEVMAARLAAAHKDYFPAPDRATSVARHKVLLLVRVIAVNGTGVSRAALWADIIPYGVGVHHSGLSVQERQVVEDAYRSGVLKILVATSTLAAGVNLPARRVVFSKPYMGINLLTPLEYKQMSGRAGRMGQGSYGESFLVCNSEKERLQCKTIMTSSIVSLVRTHKVEHGWDKLVLDMVVNRGSNKQDAVTVTTEYLMKAADMVFTTDKAEAANQLTQSLNRLCQLRLLSVEPNDVVQSTRLGEAVVSGSILPLDGFLVCQSLTGMGRWIPSSNLHLIMLMVPLSTMTSLVPYCSFLLSLMSPSDETEKARLLSQSAPFHNFNPKRFNTLSTLISWCPPSDLFCLAHFGIKVSEVKATLTRLQASSRRLVPKDMCQETFYQNLSKTPGFFIVQLERLYTALIVLFYLETRCTIQRLLEATDMLEGDIQSIVQSIFSAASSLSCAVRHLGWIPVGIVIDQFLARFCLVSSTDGTEDKLTRLGRDLPLVPNQLVKNLYAHGYRKVSQIAKAEPASLALIVTETIVVNEGFTKSELALQISHQLVLVAAISLKCRRSWKQKQAKLQSLGRAASDELFTLALRSKLTQLLTLSQNASEPDGSLAKLLKAGGSEPTNTQEAVTHVSEEIIVKGETSPELVAFQTLEVADFETQDVEAKKVADASDFIASLTTTDTANQTADKDLGDGLSSSDGERPLNVIHEDEYDWANELDTLSSGHQPHKPQRQSQKSRRTSVASGATSVLSLKSDVSGFRRAFGLPQTALIKTRSLLSDLAARDPNDMLPASSIYCSQSETYQERQMFKGSLAKLFQTINKQWKKNQRDGWRIDYIGSNDRIKCEAEVNSEYNAFDWEAFDAHIELTVTGDARVLCCEVSVTQAENELFFSLLDSQSVMLCKPTASHLNVFFPLLQESLIYGFVRDPDTSLVATSCALRFRLWGRNPNSVLIFCGDHKDLIDLYHTGCLDFTNSECEVVSVSSLLWVLNSERYHNHNISQLAVLTDVLFNEAHFLYDDVALRDPALMTYQETCTPAPVSDLVQTWCVLLVLVKLLEMSGNWRPALYIENPYLKVLGQMQEVGLPCSAFLKQRLGGDAMQQSVMNVTHKALVDFRFLRHLEVSSFDDLVLLICFIKLHMYLCKGLAQRLRSRKEESFSMTNPEEVGRILMHEILGRTLQSRKPYGSSKALMNKVAKGHPEAEEFVDLVKTYRSLKSVVQNLEAIVRSFNADSSEISQGRRIFPRYEALSSATGRLSSQMLDVLCYEKGVAVTAPVCPLEGCVPSHTRLHSARVGSYPSDKTFETLESETVSDLEAKMMTKEEVPGQETLLSSLCPVCMKKLLSGSHIWGSLKSMLCERHRNRLKKIAKHKAVPILVLDVSANVQMCLGTVSEEDPNTVEVFGSKGQKKLGHKHVDQVWLGPVRETELPNLPDLPLLEIGPRHLIRPGVGNVLVAVDYCQIELRLLTHFSGDPLLIKALESGEDPFASIAAAWLKKTPDAVLSAERKAAKKCIYGIIYGMGKASLMKNLEELMDEEGDTSQLAQLLGKSDTGVLEEPKDPMDSFFEAFPVTQEFLNFLKSKILKDGFVQTLSGRRRYFPPLKRSSSSDAIISKCVRQAVNTLCQGSAADLMKIIQCAVAELFAQAKCGARIILQVHDELLFEIPENAPVQILHSALDLIVTTVPLRVPLEAKWRIARSWADCAT